MATPTRLRWGVLGTGSIAAKFAAQAQQWRRGELAAVGSRDASKAAKFAATHGASESGDYESLMANPNVDAVYVSLPNSLHHPWTIAALRAGKHVLCEKPMAGSRAAAEEMFAVARETDRRLVEAFMYRTHPCIHRAIELVRSGALGDLKLIRSHFTFNREARPDDCRYQADLAGGALMDVGCYCINFSRALAGREPDSAHVVAHRHPLGVEDYAAGVLRFGGVIGSFSCGMTVENDRTTYIGGSDAYLMIDTPWFCDGRMTMVRAGGKEREEIHIPADQDLYALEADAFAACVLDGVDPWITEADTLGNLQVLDDLRAQISSG